MAAKPKTPEPAQEIDLLELLLKGANDKDFQDVSIQSYRTHLLYGEIDEISAQETCEFLLKCYKMDPTKPVELIINSPGGSCADGFAIIDLMASLGLTVKTLALGQVCSMGFMIFVAGSPGERVISPNCSLMMHQFYAGNEGKMHELEAAYREFKNLDDRIVSHLAQYTNLTPKRVKSLLLPSHDVFLTATEAIKLGVGDRILTKGT